MKTNFVQLSRSRRSTRRFTDAYIDDEKINRILKTALTAPTGFGEHPVEFVVIRDKAMIHNIAQCKRMGASPLDIASVAVIVFADRSDELWIEDSSIAASYILLAAEENDVGACWIHMRNRAGQKTTADEEIRSLLNIPPSYTVLCAIAMGEKNETKLPYTDESLPVENIHFEKY